MVETKKKEEVYKFRRHIRLTGIRELKDTQKGRTAVIWCSGPTFAAYDDGKIPDDWVRFSGSLYASIPRRKILLAPIL